MIRLAVFVHALLAACFVVPLSSFGDDEPGLEVIDVTAAGNQDVSLDQFLWLQRVIIVLSDTSRDPRFVEQLELLEAEWQELVARDVIVLTDTDPSADSGLREKLRPRGFAIVIVGKDGGVKLRKPFPWSVREISRSIDKFPLRQRELRSN